MALIMIRCPAVGRAVSTGIEVAEDVNRLPTVVATTVCPACGHVHKWTKNDAWVTEGGEYYRQMLAC